MRHQASDSGPGLSVPPPHPPPPCVHLHHNLLRPALTHTSMPAHPLLTHATTPSLTLEHAHVSPGCTPTLAHAPLHASSTASRGPPTPHPHRAPHHSQGSNSSAPLTRCVAPGQLRCSLSLSFPICKVGTTQDAREEWVMNTGALGWACVTHA